MEGLRLMTKNDDGKSTRKENLMKKTVLGLAISAAAIMLLCSTVLTSQEAFAQQRIEFEPVNPMYGCTDAQGLPCLVAPDAGPCGGCHRTDVSGKEIPHKVLDTNQMLIISK
jgi:hypothetical protein